jgi:hypothetical protein
MSSLPSPLIQYLRGGLQRGEKDRVVAEFGDIYVQLSINGFSSIDKDNEVRENSHPQKRFELMVRSDDDKRLILQSVWKDVSPVYPVKDVLVEIERGSGSNRYDSLVEAEPFEIVNQRTMFLVAFFQV